MSKKVIKEVEGDDFMLSTSKMPPNINPKTTSKSTSDKIMRMVAQPFVFSNYRRYYGESVLPYNEEADKHKDNPKKFYNFLKEKGAENTFETYFTDEKPVDTKLKEISRQKAIGIIEDILTKRQIYNDVFNKENEDSLPTLDEVKGKNKLIFSQLDKILEYAKNNLSGGEKKLVLSYIHENLI